jgi:uncharacterized membrane protein YadS
VSAVSGQVATAVKLARVLMLGPVVLFFAMRARRTGEALRAGEARLSLTKLVPWFVVGFTLLAVLRSSGAIGDGEANAAKLVAGWLTILAMAGLGLSVDVRSVRAVGARVVVAVAGSLLVLIGLAVALIRVLSLLKVGTAVGTHIA